MPRKERGEHVPEAIAFHGFNNNHEMPPTTDVDIVHVASQLVAFGLLTPTDMIEVATRLNVLLLGKAFTAKGQSWQVVKVFNASDTSIKMRCQLVVSEQSGNVDTEAC